MTIEIGERLPEASLSRMGAEGPETVSLAGRLAGRRVVIFAVPGAFTPTCHSAHMPSFVRTRAQFADKGVDEVICVTVNDPFVTQAWDRASGAAEAGITVLADPLGEFTAAIGMTMNAPDRGLVGRSSRYAMLVEDGVVSVLHREQSGRVCELTAGESMLAVI